MKKQQTKVFTNWMVSITQNESGEIHAFGISLKNADRINEGLIKRLAAFINKELDK